MKLEKIIAKSTFYILTLDPGNENFTFSIEELEPGWIRVKYAAGGIKNIKTIDRLKYKRKRVEK